ncbi:unnamed protein product [Spirodela intermedia]|uniref:cinnamyl-alcohol dehydrogenase n=1 Tax=Spirodela intermedia TaxID=51605 RepID=A0A7I8KA56_SPIIN|nr:unnamed protein product [Spirodela intermedia]
MGAWATRECASKGRRGGVAPTKGGRGVAAPAKGKVKGKWRGESAKGKGLQWESVLLCAVLQRTRSPRSRELGSSSILCRRHEIVGVVTEVGSRVEKFKVGDKVGVGCMVSSCRSCESCEQGFENDCAAWVLTYGSIDRDGTMTYGGFSDVLVADEHFVVRFPDHLPMDGAAPLLCAGITVYSPMKQFGLNEPGKHLGIVGLGGLGHIAVKFAKAFGMKATVITTSPSKEREAIDKFRADSFLVSRSLDQMEAAAGTMDGIIDTVAAIHPLGPLFSLMKNGGNLILMGMPDKPLKLPAFSAIRGRKKLAGSCIGGMRDTQEMLDFAGKHEITANVEVIPMEYVSTAMERLAKNDIKYRFVIDVANTLKAAE